MLFHSRDTSIILRWGDMAWPKTNTKTKSKEKTKPDTGDIEYGYMLHFLNLFLL